jgi:hypothetical protein
VSDHADDDVPKLPRGRGLRLSRPQMMRIAGTLLLLVFLVVAQRPCADAVSTFVTGFGDRGSAAAVMPRPGTVDMPVGSSGSSGPSGSTGADNAASDPGAYERLRPGMTDEEVKAVIDRARAKAKANGSIDADGRSAGSAAGTGSATNAGSGNDREIR